MALGSIISTGASILGSLFGSSESKKQRKLQQAQFEEQKRLANEQLKLAQDAARMGKATQVDANGNVTMYDEATNTWKVVLTPEQQELLQAANYEQYQQLTQDAALSRGDRLSSARRRTQEGAVADTFLDQVRDRASGSIGTDPQDIASSLRLARERAVTQGFDDVSNTLATQALRSGAGGMDRLGTALARARAREIAATMGNPELEGRQIARQFNAEDLTNATNQYGLYAARASNPGTAPYNIPNVAGGANSALAGARASASQGVGQAGALTGSAASINAANTPPAPYNWSSIFEGIANLANSPASKDIGSVLGGVFNKRRGSNNPSSDLDGYY